MRKITSFQGFVVLLGALCCPLWGGVDKEIQKFYQDKYNNHALFLKIPVRGFRQVVLVSDSPSLDSSTAGQPLAFKVGDQVRIIDVDFKNDSIRFKIAAVDFSRESELIFQFPRSLTDGFSERGDFDAALDYALTAGLSYKEIDSAKEDFIKDQFDQLIERFAATTGTSSQYVIQTISEKNPEFQRLRRELDEKRRQETALRDRVQTAESKSRQAESNLVQLRRQLSQAETDADSLKEEKERLEEELQDARGTAEKLEAENRKWSEKDRQYQKQVNELIQSLEVKSDSTTELDSQVRSLGVMIDSLKTERGDLSGKLRETSRLVEQLQSEKKQLSEELEKVEKQRARLSANLKDLTSDKNSLQSRFLQTKQQKEALETAQSLRGALRLRAFSEPEGGRTSAPLYLLSKKIGGVELEIPQQTGSVYRLKFQTDSPDTVKFTEEERRLYSALGEKLRVQAQWVSNADGVQASLAQGEPIQSAAPRETAEWQWSFEGSPSGAAPVSLKLSLLDENEQRIEVADREFLLNSGGLSAWLNGDFSGWALLLSFLVGSVAAGVLGVAVGRSRSRTPAANPRQPTEFPVHKRL